MFVYKSETFFKENKYNEFVITLLLSQLQCLFNHDTDSIKNLVKGSVAHEGRGGDQLILYINVSFLHIFVHMFAAHLRHSTCCLSVWPPEDEKKEMLSEIVF